MNRKKSFADVSNPIFHYTYTVAYLFRVSNYFVCPQIIANKYLKIQSKKAVECLDKNNPVAPDLVYWAERFLILLPLPLLNRFFFIIMPKIQKMHRGIKYAFH